MAKRLTQLSHSQILATLASGEPFTLRYVCLYTPHTTAGEILIPEKTLEQPAKPSASEQLEIL